MAENRFSNRRRIPSSSLPAPAPGPAPRLHGARGPWVPCYNLSTFQGSLAERATGGLSPKTRDTSSPGDPDPRNTGCPR